MNESAKKASNNLFWRLLEKFGAQGVTFVVSILLARLLDPSVYGIIAIVTIFVTIMQVFVDSGLGNSLIQKKKADDLDFSSVFWFNVTFCLILYVIFFFVSPLISNWFGIPELTSVLRVLSLTIVISGVKNVQQAYVSKHMQFKKFFFATLGGTVGAAIIGVCLAYAGYGIWALVIQSLFNTFVDTIILWVVVKWRPSFVFSFKRINSLFSFGWKILVSKLIDTIYEDIRSLIIGKVYSSSDLAFYNRGKQFPSLLVSNINSSIDSVLFPTMSAVQEKTEQVKSMTRRSIKVSSFIIFPMMAGLAACSSPLVRVLLTDKWIECVPYLQILSCAMAFYPILTSNLNAIKAIGRSDIYLKLEITRKLVNAVFLLVAMWFGVWAIALSLLANSLVNLFINAFPNKKLINYGYLEQVKDILPTLGISIIMGVCVFCINLLNISNWLLLLIEVPIGILIYLGLARVFKIDSLTYVITIAKSYLKKN